MQSDFQGSSDTCHSAPAGRQWLSMDSHVAMYFRMEEVEDDIYDILEEGRLYTLDILAKFRGEIVRPPEL